MFVSRDFVEAFATFGAETVRTVLPLLIKVAIETLTARWLDEVLVQRSVIRCFLFIGAWAHKV